MITMKQLLLTENGYLLSCKYEPMYEYITATVFALPAVFRARHIVMGSADNGSACRLYQCNLLSSLPSFCSIYIGITYCLGMYYVCG